MKITTKELRNGTIIVRNAQVLQVISFQNMNDIYRLQVMNYSYHEKQIVDIPVNEELETVVPEVFKAEFSYSEGDTYYFFNLDTDEEIAVEKGAVYKSEWMVESQSCTLRAYNGNVFFVEPARYVDIKVVKIEPSFSPVAVLENGVKIAVNSRVGVGDIVRVDTISEQMIY